MQQQVLDYTNGDLYEVQNPRCATCYKDKGRVSMRGLRLPCSQGSTLGTMRHGWGKHTCANGDKYTGNWRLDKRHGRGRAMFARGVEYEGEWADDRAEGCAGARSGCCSTKMLRWVICSSHNQAVHHANYELEGPLMVGWLVLQRRLRAI